MKFESESKLEQKEVGEGDGAGGTKEGSEDAEGRRGEREVGVRGACRREVSSIGSVESKEVTVGESVRGWLEESTGGSAGVGAVADATCCLVTGARMVVLPRAEDRVELLMSKRRSNKRTNY